MPFCAFVGGHFGGTQTVLETKKIRSTFCKRAGTVMHEWHRTTFEGGVITVQLPSTATTNDSGLLCSFSQTHRVQKYTNWAQMINSGPTGLGTVLYVIWVRCIKDTNESKSPLLNSFIHSGIDCTKCGTYVLRNQLSVHVRGFAFFGILLWILKEKHQLHSQQYVEETHEGIHICSVYLDNQLITLMAMIACTCSLKPFFGHSSLCETAC